MDTREHVIALLEFSRWYSNGLLEGMNDQQLIHQPSPTDNHALWAMGHLAGTDAWIGNLVGASITVPENISKAFGMGSRPGPTGNPPAADVKKIFAESRKILLDWVKSAPQSALTMDLKEKTNGFATDTLDALAKIAWHEGFHFGQVANVRKALGLKNLLG